MSPLIKKSRANSDAIRYPPMDMGRTTHVPTATVPVDPGTLANGGNAFYAEERPSIQRPDLFFANSSSSTTMNTRPQPQAGDSYSSSSSSSSSQSPNPLSSQLYPYHQQGYRHYTQPNPTSTPSPLQHGLPPGAYRPHPGQGYFSSNPYAQHPSLTSYTPPVQHPYGPPLPPKPNAYPHLNSTVQNVQTPPHMAQNQYFRTSTPPQTQVTLPTNPYMTPTSPPSSLGGPNHNFSNAHNYHTSPQQMHMMQQQQQYFPGSGSANYNQPQSQLSAPPLSQSSYPASSFTSPTTAHQAGVTFSSNVFPQDPYAAPSFTSSVAASQSPLSSFTAPHSPQVPNYGAQSPTVPTSPIPPANTGLSPQFTSELPGYTPSPTPPPLLPHPYAIPDEMVDRKERLVESPVDDGGDELARVLAMSESEVAERKMRELELLDQEEEDLARALAESLMTTTKVREPYFSKRDEQPSTSRKTLDDKPPLVQKVKVAEETSPPPALPDFAEFGRQDKWRIPGLADPESPIAPPKSQVALGKRKSIAPLDMMPNLTEAPPIYGSSKSPDRTSRRNSVSSTSSLPYARDELQDGREPDDMPQSSMPWVDAPAPLSSAPTDEPATVLTFDDEAYARKLAAEEEAEYKRWQEDNKKSIVLADPTPVTALPLYSLHEDKPWQGHSSAGPSSPPAAGPSPSTRFDVKPGSSTPLAAGNNLPYPALVAAQRESELDTRSEISHNSGASGSGGQHAARTSLPTSSLQSPPPVMEQTQPPPFSSATPSPSPPTAASSAPAPAPSMPATNQPNVADARFSQASASNVQVGVLNPNHFLDRELLHGVSIGFKAPVISIRLLPMEDPMPNIISLPYARCPPLHLQSPDWMHLLRLMARLSGTRIEPTVEAMAISKTELKLRTVVQFVKPHPQSPDWRTILWFSIDHPIPPAAPGANRYLSHNPNLLPWSYSLSPVPMILRDAADTHISKTYTIPPSQSVPLPNLPITFPNLALYLQAAINHSRRHCSDANGVGKLGKMVQQCYPSFEQPGPDYDIPERGVRKILNNLHFRRKKDKKNNNGTNNEETYQLVTPFVPDEWG